MYHSASEEDPWFLEDLFSLWRTAALVKTQRNCRKSDLLAEYSCNIGKCACQGDTWELLFNSNLHGASFSTWMGRVAGRGPTVVLIKDRQEALFGGFAADAWAKNGQFYGAFGSFVFGLLPAATVWKATAINHNFLWCGQNFGQLPNGFGFGGQVRPPD